MNKFVLLTLGFTFFIQYCKSQTVLQAGDLAIVALGANVGGSASDCDTGAGISGRDLVQFVCFKDILPGTTIDLTDNGWERELPERWGNVEGFLRVTRTGPVISAGTVITFEFPPNGDNYLATTPDNGWNFDLLGFSALNFNSNGDQLYFLQGGTWDLGTTVGCCNGNNDAIYEGGRILFVFNSKTEWLSLQNDSKDSGLHPAVANCFSMAPTLSTTDFISFNTIPYSSGTQLEWIARIRNPQNWITYSNCENFMQNETVKDTLSLSPSGVILECAICQGCIAINDTLSITPPSLGGPFDIAYTNGIDTFQLENVTNTVVIPTTVNTTSTFSIISLVGGDGCPVYSNLGEPLIIEIGDDAPEIVFDIVEPVSCMGNQDGQLSFTINGGQSPYEINWALLDVAPIDSLKNLNSVNALDTGSYYIVVTDANGCEGVGFETVTGPETISLTCSVTQEALNANNGIALLSMAGGNPPYNISVMGPSNQNLVLNSAGEIPVSGLPTGTYEVNVDDQNGCSTSCSFFILDQSCTLSLDCNVENMVTTINGSEGEARISFDGGIPPYKITWRGPVSDSLMESSALTFILSNLTIGDYTVFVIDGQGCQLPCSFEIEGPTCSLEALTIEQTLENCSEDATYTLEVFSSGGIGNLSYQWEDNRIENIGFPANVPPGFHQVTITDESLCQDSITVNLIQPTVLAATFQTIAPGCDGTSGRIELLEISGSNFPYLLSVNAQPSIMVDQVPFTIDALNAGNYSIEVMAADGCQRVYELTIDSLISLDLDLGPPISINFADSILVNGTTNFDPVSIEWRPATGVRNPDQLVTYISPIENTILYCHRNGYYGMFDNKKPYRIRGSNQEYVYSNSI